MQWDAGEVCQDRDKSLTHRNSSHFPTGFPKLEQLCSSSSGRLTKYSSDSHVLHLSPLLFNILT